MNTCIFALPQAQTSLGLALHSLQCIDDFLQLPLDFIPWVHFVQAPFHIFSLRLCLFQLAAEFPSSANDLDQALDNGKPLIFSGAA